MGKRGGGEEEEEEARWAVEKASERVERGDVEGAMRLLERAKRLHPYASGLPELVALAQVCHAASCSCSCSAAPHWYRILMVSEKDNLTAIKKRYRQLALLLHPDKNKHARAEEAFKLVCEAYGHLSDSKKRETFDVNKKECRKCSQPSVRRNRESLKGKNQTDFNQSCFHLHTAEWKVEHEKLRMFRERAQTKVDSLARLLKERRCRWNEESSNQRYTIRSSDKKRDCEVFKQRSQSAAQKTAFFNSHSYDEPHQWGRDKNGESKRAGGFFLNKNQKLSRILDGGGHISFVEKTLLKELRSRVSRENQVLPNLYGLLGIVKEEMGASFKGEAGDRHPSRVAEANGIKDAACPSHNNWVKNGCSNNAHMKNKKLEQEWIVIDDFLAGLHETTGRKI